MTQQTYSSIPDAIRAMAAGFSGRAALQIVRQGELQSYTYPEVITHFERAATRLKNAGIGKGDRIVLLAENMPEWPIAALAALSVGATVVPLDSLLTPGDIRSLIERADVRGLMLSAAQLKALGPDLPSGLPVFNIEDGLRAFEGHPHGPGPALPPTPDPDAGVALLLFTSGTTGENKGVLLDHAALLHTARTVADAVEPEENEIPQVLGVLPLHHVSGFMVVFLGVFLAGGTVTFVESMSAEAIVNAMRKTKTTVLPGVPRLFELLYGKISLKVAEKGKLAGVLFDALGALCAGVKRFTPWNPGPFLFRSVHKAFGGSLKACCSGAAPLPVSVRQGLERLGFIVAEAYGLTETSGAATVNSFSRRRPGTVGQPVAETRIRIANPLPSTGEGEVCIRGPILMRGYFRDEQATGEAIRDGWLYTGDLGRIDHDGYLTITGRLKDLIVTSAGKNVSPQQVEERYHGLPGVKELAVFGMPAKEGFGEDVHAAVVVDLEAGGDTRNLQQRVEAEIQNLAPEIPSHMRIQRLHVLSELPKTTTLKVRRAELKQMVSATAEMADTRQVVANTQYDELTRKVLAAVKETLRDSSAMPALTTGTTLQFELGIDSIGLIDLTARLESTFGVSLDEHRLQALYSISDLVDAVKAASKQRTVSGYEPEAESLSAGHPGPVPPPRGVLSRLFFAAVSVAMRGLWKIEVSGQEHVPGQGASIICPNHESYLDTLVVSSCLKPAQKRNWCSFAKRELFEHFPTNLMVRLGCAIPTDRDRNIWPALRAAVEVLRQGRTLIIHPEGTRTRTGELGPFKTGAARLALATGTPLVPVRILGARDVYPVYRSLPRLFDWRNWRRHSLKIIFGPAIEPVDAARAEERQLTERLRQAVVALDN